MQKKNFEKIMDRLYKIETELFKITTPPKHKIGDKIVVMGTPPGSKIITDIALMGCDSPTWFYSFGVSQDWTPEDDIYSINEIKNV